MSWGKGAEPHAPAASRYAVGRHLIRYDTQISGRPTAQNGLALEASLDALAIFETDKEGLAATFTIVRTFETINGPKTSTADHNNILFTASLQKNRGTHRTPRDEIRCDQGLMLRTCYVPSSPRTRHVD
jgi:hypothetical protein